MGTLRNPKRVLSKALKFTSKDQSREILTCVHLDERGEVVACDSYRLFTATGWSGPSIDVPSDLAKKMARIPAKYEEVEVVQVDGVIECRYGGNVLKGDAVEGEYPKYRQLFDGWEASAVSEVPAKQAAVICRAHKREGVFVEIGDGATVVWGAGCDTEPSAMFKTGCQGEGRVKLNAEYLESALKACGERACIKVMKPSKPVFVAWGVVSVMLMPLMDGRTYTEPLIKKLTKREEQDMAKQTKKEERMETIKLQGERVCITGTLPTMTRGEAFTRLKLVGGVPCERFNKKVTLFVIAAKAGRDKRKKAEAAIANGQKVRIVDGHEFVEALKAAEQEQTAKAVEKAAKHKAGADVKATVNEVGTGVTAIVMEPKEKEDNVVEELKKQVEELRAELKSTRKELDEVWKENAHLKAKPKAEVPPAPKAPKHEKVETAAAAVSLSFMDMDAEGAERCMEVIREAVRPGIEDGTVSVRWKGKTLAPIRVEGATKPFHDELDELGLRWAGKSKYWYLSPTKSA